MADPRYREAKYHLWEALGIPMRGITDFEKLQQVVANKELTHLFIGVGEYTDEKAYFEGIDEDIKVFVMYDPQYPMEFGGNVRGLQLPFYSISLVSALSGEAFCNQLIDKKNMQITFRAPTVRALIVDDNEINLRVAEGVLKLYGINCILARSGKEAIDLLKDKDMDIVFMDHMMPEMDGIETAEVIRRVYGGYGKQLPIIALTANAVNDARDMFMEHGFQDFLSKPIGMKTVDAVLQKWLPRNKMEPVETTAAPSSAPKTVQPQKQEVPVPSMVIHAEAALENMGGMEDLYQELLEYCLEMEEQRKAEITESYEQQDWTEYQIRVHAFKGAMRSLGIDEMALVAQQQEVACKEGRIEDAKKGHAHLIEEFNRAHRSIEQYLKGKAPAGNT
jgi:CheY-like chemotaxis protein/HPt (histidine-containing phosphotransfer) domain-containing protein